MPRFAKDGDVWVIEQTDKTLSITEAGKTVVRRFVSAEHAAKQLAKLVGAKLDAGFYEAPDAPPPARPKSREDELIEAILANPDDPSPYAVLADHLVEADDRRGELISLQLAAERDPKLRVKVERYVAKHAQRMLGALSRRLGDLDDLDGPVTWRRGFVDAMVVNRKNAIGDLAELVDDVLAAPALRLVRRIVIKGGRADLRQPCAVIAQHAPAGLATLELYGLVPTLESVLRALPHLRELVVIARDDGPSPAVRSLASAPMPALARLDIRCAWGDHAGLFTRGDLPALRELCLRIPDHAADVLVELAAGPLAAQLEVLDLGHGWHRPDDLAFVVANHAKFPRLHSLVIVPNDDDDPVDAPFKVSAPKRHVYTDDDLGDDDDDHYEDIVE